MKATYTGWSNDKMCYQVMTKLKMYGGRYEVEDYTRISKEMAEKLTVGQVIDVEISCDGVRLLQPWEIK